MKDPGKRTIPNLQAIGVFRDIGMVHPHIPGQLVLSGAFRCFFVACYSDALPSLGLQAVHGQKYRG